MRRKPKKLDVAIKQVQCTCGHCGDDDDSPFEFDCPFCGLHCAALTRPPSLVHRLPMCPEFRDSDPENFMVTVLMSVQALNGPAQGSA